MKGKILFISMIVVICSFIGELSIVGLLLFAIGFSLVVTMLELPLVYGGRFMKKTKRRICLGIGVMLSILAFLGEISWVAFGMFAIGFLAVVLLLNSMVENKVKNEEI